MKEKKEEEEPDKKKSKKKDNDRHSHKHKKKDKEDKKKSRENSAGPMHFTANCEPRALDVLGDLEPAVFNEVLFLC